MSELELTVSRTIRAPRQKVFEAWLKPETLSKIMRPGADDLPARVTNDPVKGGRFMIIDSRRSASDKARARSAGPAGKGQKPGFSTAFVHGSVFL